MKNYKQQIKTFIGASDRAELTCVSNGKEFPLYFGQDNAYHAYILDETYDIPSHYDLVYSFENDLKIIDDEKYEVNFNGKKIEVYRAKEMGCIVRVLND